MLRARPDFYLERGTLSLRASEIRQVGLGELLARLERLRRLLAAEGLFAAERKRPLPFLPQRIGLITGRASAAERDVVENARRRLPGVAVPDRERRDPGRDRGQRGRSTRCGRLDADAEVDVIVIARGGGSVEDLLPFSNESAGARGRAQRARPVVSAIGHETDVPLLDLVADLAASTPTDAAKRIVPDLAEELRRLTEARARARAAVHRRLTREHELMAGLPGRLRRAVQHRVQAESIEVDALRARGRRRLSGTARRRTRRPCAPASADAGTLTASHPRPWLRGRPHRGRDGGARTRTGHRSVAHPSGCRGVRGTRMRLARTGRPR